MFRNNNPIIPKVILINPGNVGEERWAKFERQGAALVDREGLSKWGDVKKLTVSRNSTITVCRDATNHLFLTTATIYTHNNQPPAPLVRARLRPRGSSPDR